MGKNCIVYGCHNLSTGEKHLHYYKLPKVITNHREDWQKFTEDRRRLWLDLTGKNIDLTLEYVQHISLKVNKLYDFSNTFHRLDLETLVTSTRI